MKCPECGKLNSAVLETRVILEGAAIKRRRLCESCQTRFTTLERMDASSLMVKKRNKTKEPYTKEKIERGVRLALSKRPFSDEQILQIINNVENVIIEKGLRVIESKEIGKIVMKFLMQIDKVAYLRFASVCNSFDDLNEFENELKVIK
ncbi:MAG TPA: transcriptional regulator NrdR [bacterium]|nr:transcriptional regulator NrdR [bacterium]